MSEGGREGWAGERRKAGTDGRTDGWGRTEGRQTGVNFPQHGPSYKLTSGSSDLSQFT